MASALNEPTVKETVARLGRGIDNAKAGISDRIEDGKMAAERLLRRGQYAVEGAVEESVHGIRRKPISSVVLAFTVGIAVGFLVSWLRKPAGPPSKRQ